MHGLKKQNILPILKKGKTYYMPISVKFQISFESSYSFQNLSHMLSTDDPNSVDKKSFRQEKHSSNLLFELQETKIIIMKPACWATILSRLF
jgi:hypothetical protein